MLLTADTFHEIVGSLRSDGKGSGGSKEHRKNPRVGVRGRTSIMIPAKAGARQFPASVRDLSAEGVGLLIAEPLLQAGEEFVMLLPAGQRHGRRAVVYTVRRASTLGVNQFAVGGQFVREVQMDAAAAPPATAVPARPPARPARPAPPAAGGAGTITQGLSADLLRGADDAAVSEVEGRLRKLTA